MPPNHSILLTILLITLSFIQISHSQNSTCHYTCTSCTSPAYYHCLSCPLNRGSPTNPLVPFAGMCYCSSQADESATGQCVAESTFSLSKRSLIWAFAILTLIVSSCMLLIRGFRYYFIKIIEDIQQLSVIIYINMYFPQHFDLLLTQMYRFNISSFLFQKMTNGGLFQVGPDGAVISLDGMNVPGKYNLLFKTANFFSNMFTWTIVLLMIIGFMVLVRFLRNRFANQNEGKTVEKVVQDKMNASQAEIMNQKNNESFVMSENQSQISEVSPQKQQIVRQRYQITKITRKQPYNYTFPNLITKLYHLLHYNFLIIFFYLSLIQLNINIFTQMKHLSFVSGFAGFGSILSIFFFLLEIAAIAWLFYKCRQELPKPDWMQDHSYTALVYLIRTNYKSLSKYFFFFSVAKKICFSLLIVAYYEQPQKAIQAFSILQMIFVCFSLYIEPFEKRYLRIHFYTCEMVKLFFFLSLINFVQKYKQYTTLTDVTQVFFTMLGLIFGFHFFVLLFCLLMQRKVYYIHLKRIYYKLKRAYNKSQKCQQQLKNNEMVVGYFHYVWEEDEPEVKQQSEKPKMEDISKDLKELELSGSVNMSEVEEKKEQQEEEQGQEEKERKYFFVYKNYEK